MSKNAVSVAPSRNAGCRSTLTNRSRLVRMPWIRVRFNASARMAAACRRVGAHEMTLASMGS